MSYAYFLTSKTLPDTPQMTSSFLFLCTGELFYVLFISLLISTMYIVHMCGRERGGCRGDITEHIFFTRDETGGKQG
jgi:hypothetical protein